MMPLLKVTSEQMVRLGRVLWPGSRVQALLCCVGTSTALHLCWFSVTWGESGLGPGRGAQPEWCALRFHPARGQGVASAKPGFWKQAASCLFGFL